MANRFLSNIRINDAYTFPASDGLSGQAIITDGAGNLSFGTVSGGGGGQTSSVVYRENFTGDGSTTDFQLTRNITDENITQIYLDGIYQEKDAYEIIDFDTIRFSAAPPSGHSIEVLYFYAIDAIPQPSTSVIYRDNFTGDGTTTDFTLANSISNEDYTQIYIDGAYQEKDTYTVTGTTLSFTTAPVSGHSVEVISIAGLTTPYSPTTIYQDNFTGDGSTVAFTLQNAVDDEVKTMVYFNGVYQFKGTYTLDGVTITFDAAPANGVEIEVITIASASGFEYEAQKILFYGKASEAITKGDAVMFAGAEGDHFLLAKATQAAIASNHEYFLGLANETLAQGDFGYVVEFGTVSEIDTTAYTAGDILWFDAGGSTAGALTTTEPAAPLTKIQVAAVVRSHQDEGVLFVRPTWYHKLGELSDVNITSAADKDLLIWDASNGYWENGKLALSDLTNVASTSPSDGQVLTYDTVNGWQPEDSQGGSYTIQEISTNTTAQAEYLYVLTDTLTLTLPASPNVGDKVALSNLSGTTTPVVARNGNLIAGLAEDVTIDVENLSVEFIYSGANQGWIIFVDAVLGTTAGGSAIDGSGTTNYLSKWTDANTLTDSVIYDDGTNVGIGIVPASGVGSTGIQIDYGRIEGRPTLPSFSEHSTNSYSVSGVRKYIVDGYASRYTQYEGVHYWLTAPSGTAGNNISFTEKARIDNDGLKFNGDTTAANALDDYEEGTWTPTVIGRTSPGTAFYYHQSGFYTKIGRVVHFTCYVSWESGTGTGQLAIYGLPFTPSSTANSFNSVTIGEINNITLTANNYPTASISPNIIQINFAQYPVGGGTVTILNYDAAGYIIASGTYFV